MVLRRFVSSIGEAYNQLSFGFELLRGRILDPLPSLVLRCIQFVERTRNPAKPLEDKLCKELQNGYQEEAYSLHLSELSFFDPFQSIDGVPFNCFYRESSSIELEGTVHAGESSSTIPIPKTLPLPRNQRKTVSMRKTRGDGPAITSCVFSFDGRRFAMCYTSGDVIVWDTIHGNEVAKTTYPLRSQILAISFIQSSNSMIQIFTKDCKCYRWKLENNSLHEEDISYLWRKSEQEEDQVELHTADFFDNGSIVVCSSIRNSPSMHKIEFVIGKIDLLFEFETDSKLEVGVEKGSVVAEVEMSPDGKGLLVGIVDASTKNGKCLLWHSFRENSDYILLDTGTLGSWSSNGELVVTWIVQNDLNQEGNDRRNAFVWNVKELRNNMNHAQYASDSTLLRSPFEGRVIWCRLVLDVGGRDRLIMAVVGTTTRFLFWDVHSKTHTHTIATDIATKDMTLESDKAWLDSQLAQKSVRGLSSFALTMDRSKFGAVLRKPSRLLIWDSTLGVQYLKLSPQQSEASEIGDGVNIMFSPTNGKIAMVGEHIAMVFAPSTPSALSTNHGGIMETPMIEIDTLEGKETLNTRYKLLFSGDGTTLGVLPIGLNKMQVHHLPKNAKYTIETDPTIDDDIDDFCVSMNGEYIATNTAKGIMHIWRCIGERGECVGEIREGIKTLALGITQDGKEIVVCSNKGDLFWYRSNEDASRSNDEAFHESVAQKKTLLSRSFTRTRSASTHESRRSFLEREQGFSHSLSLDSFSRRQQRLSSFYCAHSEESGRVEVTSCRLSASCEKGVRLLKSEYIEVWNLIKRQKEQTIAITIPFSSHSLTQDLLPISRTRPSFNLASNENQDFEGNDFSFLDSRRVIVPERDGFLVVADITSSSTLFQGPTDVDGSSRPWQRYQRDISSISILNSLRDQRQLKGKDLHPENGTSRIHPL